MKHISREMLNKIETASEAIANLETGSRNAQKAKASAFIKYANLHARDVKTAPKSYTIYYTKSYNLGTRKWSDCYTDYTWVSVNADNTVRETDKSVIIEHTVHSVTDYTVKKVIDKDRILAYIW